MKPGRVPKLVAVLPLVTATGMLVGVLGSTAPAHAAASTSAVHVARMDTGSLYKNGAELEMSPALAGTSSLVLPANADVDPNFVLNGISCLSAGNCATAGGYTDSSGLGQAMVAEETNGTWAQASEGRAPVNANAEPRASFGGISCSGAGNCSAAGGYTDPSGYPQAMVATETGGTWAQATEVMLPANAATAQNAFLNGASCTSAGNCTAVGWYTDTTGTEQALAVTETDGTWAQATEVPTPSDPPNEQRAYLNSVSCWSSGNCVAVGVTEFSDAIGVTETAGTWAPAVVVTAPPGAGAGAPVSLDGVSCWGAGECTAVGSYMDSTGAYEAMAASGTAGTWAQATEVALPSNAGTSQAQTSLRAVSCPSTGDCTAVGSYGVLPGLFPAMVATETTGAWGRAAEVGAPNNEGSNPYATLDGVSCPSTGECGAAGGYLDSSSSQEGMASTGTIGTWAQATEVVAPANAGTNPYAVLDAVSCQSVGNCTAAGSYTDASGDRQAMVASEANGTWAQAVEVPAPVGAALDPAASLDAISCPSAGACTASGGYMDLSSNQEAMVATGTNGSWAQATEVAAPATSAANPAASLDAISCQTGGYCSAVGQYTGSTGNGQAMVATEAAGAWSSAAELALPANAGTIPSGGGLDPYAYLDAISCWGAGDYAAAGGYTDSSSNQQAMVAAETAGTWAQGSEVTSPSNAGNDPYGWLMGISCWSAGDCTASGKYVVAGNLQAMVASGSGGTWAEASELALPSNAGPAQYETTFHGISCWSGGDCTAAGEYTDSAGAGQAMVATGWSGTWAGPASEVTAPATAANDPFASLDAISCSSDVSCTAVGGYWDGQNFTHAMVVTVTPQAPPAPPAPIFPAPPPTSVTTTTTVASTTTSPKPVSKPTGTITTTRPPCLVLPSRPCR